MCTAPTMIEAQRRVEHVDEDLAPVDLDRPALVGAKRVLQRLGQRGRCVRANLVAADELLLPLSSQVSRAAARRAAMSLESVCRCAAFIA